MSESQDRNANETKIRVLLVDDNELLLQAMVAVLSHMAVTPCRSAKQALQVLEQDANYDVIVTDMRMPDIPGAEFYARTVERFPRFAERFVFITGNTAGAERAIADANARKPGSEPPILLLKPVMPEDITDAIMKALERAETGSNGNHQRRRA